MQIDGDYYLDEMNPIAIEFDPVEGQVYWTDQYSGIHRVDPRGGPMTDIITRVGVLWSIAKQRFIKY